MTNLSEMCRGRSYPTIWVGMNLELKTGDTTRRKGAASLYISSTVLCDCFVLCGGREHQALR